MSESGGSGPRSNFLAGRSMFARRARCMLKGMLECRTDGVSRRNLLAWLVTAPVIAGCESAMSQFHCTQCGRAIFRKEDIVRKAELWDLGEYRAEAYVIRKALAIEGLTRYDVSLHEGWYCCRFIMMRMTVDKFGTGRELLVYTDSVVEVPEGATPPKAKQDKGQIALTARDYREVTENPAGDELRVVKFGAIWCPPCRLVDSVIQKLSKSGGLPNTRFFEVDVDTEPTLGGMFPIQSIPYLAFYQGGRWLRLVSSVGNVQEGVWVGGINAASLRTLCAHVREQATVGRQVIEV